MNYYVFMPMQGVIPSSSKRLLHSGVSQVIELLEALWSRLLGAGVRAGLLAASNRSVALETRRGSAHSDGGAARRRICAATWTAHRMTARMHSNRYNCPLRYIFCPFLSSSSKLFSDATNQLAGFESRDYDQLKVDLRGR